MPRVSVIIPSYNRADLVGETIESVLSQSFTDLELIVVDDGSTDDTRDVVSRFSGPIKYIHQENKGRSQARNRGLDVACGEYLCFLDSDDLLAPHKLKLQVELLDTDDDMGFVYCDYQFIDQSGKPLNKPDIYSSHPLQRGHIFRQLLYFDFIPPSAVLIRRRCLESSVIFDVSMKAAEDFDWLLRVSRRYKADYIHEPLCLIRVHGGNTPAEAIAEATIRVLVKHLCLDETRSVLGKDWRQVYRDCYLTVANFHYNRGDMKNARQYFFKVLRSTAPSKYDLETIRMLCKSLSGKTILSMARQARNAITRMGSAS